MIDKSIINSISEKANIVTIISYYLNNVTKKGKYFFALCPFHNDTHPSLQIDAERNLFRCWVDGHHGNVFSFVMQYENVNFIEAVKKVANIIGFKNTKLDNIKKKEINPYLKSLFNCINDLSLYYEYCLSQQIYKNNNLKSYLVDRGITKNIIKKFHLGYAIKNSELTINVLKNKGYSIQIIDDIGFLNYENQKNVIDINRDRIIFPIFNDSNQVVGFSARKINNNPEEPKYINSAETKIFTKKKLFFNLNNVQNTIKINKFIYLLEGFMDVIALDKIGFNNAIAIMGTNLSDDHAQILKKMNIEIRLCFDNDLAGQQATFNAISTLRRHNICTMVVNYLVNEKDPDEILKFQGSDELKKNLNNLITDFEFSINFCKKNLKNNTEIIKYFVNFLSKEDEVKINDYVNQISKNFSIPDSDLEKIKNIHKNKIISENIFFKNENIKLNKIEQIEKNILHFMFFHNKAIEFYKNKIEYFDNLYYKNIANCIVDFYDNSKNECNQVNKLSDLITTIEFDFYNQKIDEKTKKIFDLLMKEEEINKLKFIYPKFNEKLLTNYLFELNNERNNLVKKKNFYKMLKSYKDEELANKLDDIKT